MFQTSMEIVSAIRFALKESFADKRYAGEVYAVGDRFRIIDGPYAGVRAEAVRLKTLNGAQYLYARDVKTGEMLRYPICFARQLQSLEN